MIPSRCAACKYLRRRCSSNCIFSPYFPSNNPQRFAIVHRIYGASNVAKFLQQVPMDLRGEAAETLYFEAKCRIEDPIYGCVGIISQLQYELHVAETQLAKTRAEIALLASNRQQAQHEDFPFDDPSSGPIFTGLSTPAHFSEQLFRA
uniref:LOB domain-containing protein n=1 Tax=Cucumis sativus TaxID=3659 RepID=A0A0A0LLX6_CUCSA